MTPEELLAAYDAQLRSDAETPSALSVERCGPLRLVVFPGGRGFVTYRDLGGAGSVELARLVDAAVRYFDTAREIVRVEWKTRGHDRAPGLHESLVASGFVPQESESIMVGCLADLVSEARLPEGVSIRRVHEEIEVRAMCAMQDEVFGDPPSEDMANAILRRLALHDGMQLWVAEAGDLIVSAGRLEPVAGTEFAGIWGGATRPEWRGRGIYRALTSARATAALQGGSQLVHSDSTEFSRPILERSGLVKVSTTTPYEWRRS